MTTQPMPALTEEPEAPPAPERTRTVIVEVERDSRLETLCCLWETAKAKHDAAEAAYKELCGGIFAELTAKYPDTDIKAYEIPATKMYPALTYGFKKQAYLPAPKIRQFMNPVYEAFKQFKEYWMLSKTSKR
jgi:hypothetical protein